jgi:hypothetical protein
MKFLKENWYKLMTGTAMLIFACGFFIYAVGPSYAIETSEVNKPQMESEEAVNNPSSKDFNGSDFIPLGIFGGYAHYIYVTPSSGPAFYKHRTTKFKDDEM